MSPDAILALLSDLYVQVKVVSEERDAALRERDTYKAMLDASTVDSEGGRDA